jgi:hypothetical protein
MAYMWDAPPSGHHPVAIKHDNEKYAIYLGKL